jgi:hypothetical protein
MSDNRNQMLLHKDTKGIEASYGQVHFYGRWFYFGYIVLALCYLIGRTGFVNSKDVFAKLRPNRHVNTIEYFNRLPSQEKIEYPRQEQKVKRITDTQPNSIATRHEQPKPNQTASGHPFYEGEYVDPPKLWV